MSQPIDWNLLARYVAGECSVAERLEVQTVLDDHENLGEFVRVLESYWTRRSESDEDAEFLEESWRRMKAKMGETDEPSSLVDPTGNLLSNEEPRRHEAYSRRRSFPKEPGRLDRRTGSRKKQYGLAASLAAAVLVAILFWRGVTTQSTEPDAQPPIREVATITGQRATFTLADGTRITLNAESYIRLPEEFAPHLREVFLDGEAFFEVESNLERPFVVKVRGGEVEVLGTSFSIQAYDNEPSTEVVVAEGSVEVRSEQAYEHVVISPGLRAELTHEGIRTDSVVVSNYTSWTDGRLVFADARMDEVARVLKRWYGTDVEFGEAGIEDLRVTANLKGRFLRDVLDVLATTVGLEYELDGGVITFVRV